MTYAPDDLLAVQRYCHDQTGQPWASLGIVGDTSHNSSGGYHVGHDVLHRLGRAPEDPGSDYSYTESQRDRNGLTDAASAFDMGGSFGRFLQFNAWMRARMLAGDPRTADIREMIYTLDGQAVRRIDRTGVQPDAGDNSHLSHTHFSFFRDADGRRAETTNFLGLLREFFEGATPAPQSTPAEEDIDMKQLVLTNNIMDALLDGPSPGITKPGKLRVSSHWGDSKVWVYIKGVLAKEYTVYGKDSYLELDLPASSNFAVKLLSVVEARVPTDPPTHCVALAVSQG